MERRREESLNVSLKKPPSGCGFKSSFATNLETVAAISAIDCLFSISKVFFYSEALQLGGRRDAIVKDF